MIVGTKGKKANKDGNNSCVMFWKQATLSLNGLPQLLLLLLHLAKVTLQEKVEGLHVGWDFTISLFAPISAPNSL